MFNWKPSEPQETTDERLDKHAALIAARINDMRAQWERDRADIWKAVKDASEAASKPAVAPDLTALTARITDLEGKWLTLHTLLVERSPNTGRDKLSKAGNSVAKFYGRG